MDIGFRFSLSFLVSFPLLHFYFFHLFLFSLFMFEFVFCFFCLFLIFLFTFLSLAISKVMSLLTQRVLVSKAHFPMQFTIDLILLSVRTALPSRQKYLGLRGTKFTLSFPSLPYSFRRFPYHKTFLSPRSDMKI